MLSPFFAGFAVALFAIDGDALGPDLVAADLVLAQPADSPTPSLGHFDRMRVGAGLRALVVRRGLFDAVQARAYFRPCDSFDWDLKSVRTAAAETADCPPLADAAFLPLMPWAECARFNRRFAAAAADRGDRAAFFAAVAEDAGVLHRLYAAAGDAADPARTIRARRVALRTVRDLLGGDRYAAMDFPPCVPLWAFAELDP